MQDAPKPRETEAERLLRFSKKKYANRVFTNANKYLLDEKFRVIHCKKCTAYVVITDADTDKLPRRRTDNAPVLCMDQGTVKISSTPIDEAVKVKRLKGIETQYFHACQECGQRVLYQSVPHEKDAKLVYVIEQNVIMPKLKWEPKPRCRICGYVARDEVHFEEHKRDRGHWDQSGGTFPGWEEKNDTPVNPVIVG